MGELGRSGLLAEGEAGQGPLLAEGAALLVLESLSSAQDRGAAIRAEIVGYATGTAGVEPAGRGAIDWSGVDCVVTTGPRQPSAEDRERRALEGLFQVQAARPPVTQVNWAVGHTLGAAGALQALAAVLLLERGHVPGVWGAEAGPAGFYTAFPGTDCRARRVLQVTRSLSGKTALLVFERWGQA
jgi:3-oxoacyl-[acyl-carrier-protein] synthase II